MTTHIITAMDDDTVSLYSPTVHSRRGEVTTLSGSSCPLDRDAVVALINGLNDHILAFDAANAKLKRGDKVYRNGNRSAVHVVITDEHAVTGAVDVVHLVSGAIREGKPARWFTKVNATAPAPF